MVPFTCGMLDIALACVPAVAPLACDTRSRCHTRFSLVRAVGLVALRSAAGYAPPSLALQTFAEAFPVATRTQLTEGRGRTGSTEHSVRSPAYGDERSVCMHRYNWTLGTCRRATHHVPQPQVFRQMLHLGDT